MMIFIFMFHNLVFQQHNVFFRLLASQELFQKIFFSVCWSRNFIYLSIYYWILNLYDAFLLIVFAIAMIEIGDAIVWFRVQSCCQKLQHACVNTQYVKKMLTTYFQMFQFNFLFLNEVASSKKVITLCITIRSRWRSRPHVLCFSNELNLQMISKK